MRYAVRRLSPTLDGRWLILLLIVGALVGLGTMIRWSGPPAPLDLVALGAEGQFQDTLVVPATWGDSALLFPDAVARVPLILGVRNGGRVPVTPTRLSLSVPLRYRLAGHGGKQISGSLETGSPLIRYDIETGLRRVEPGRLPEMLPAHDTLWLEVVVPSFYCVAVGDSVPEFVPATPPPLHTLTELRMFYAFDGGDLRQRRTGTLTIRLDSSMLAIPPTPQVPRFETVDDPELALPDLGILHEVGRRESRCGEPGSAMELVSTVYENEEGGARLITLEYGGEVRKHLYDLDNDGVIDRESWVSGSDGRLTSTRRSALPTPDFLLPRAPSEFAVARADSIPPDSLAGPGFPGGPMGPAADSARRAATPSTGPTTGQPAPGAQQTPQQAPQQAAEEQAEPEPEPEPEPPPPPPQRRRSVPLGQPIDDG